MAAYCPFDLPGQSPCFCFPPRRCLELFLDYLPKRFPQLYRVEGEGAARVVHVALTGEAHRVADFAARPLELCGRIAQARFTNNTAFPGPACFWRAAAPFGDAR